MKNFFYVIIIAFFLVLLGQYNAKWGLALSALIFLGAVVLNVDKYKEILTGGSMG